MTNKAKYFVSVALITLFQGNIAAQETAKNDSTRVSTEEKKSDRNVMLNASNNTGPRAVNMGLPAGAGGTSIVENGIPVVYLMWPELPTKVWRQDMMLNSFQLYDLGTTAINYGDVGHTVVTGNNLGTEKLHGGVSLNTNHHGLLRGSFSVSAPLNKKGLMFAVGGYWNYDPGTYKVKFTNYYSDQSQLYKAALTQKYKFSGGSGKISAFYKYMDSKGLIMSMMPYKYTLDGKAESLDGMDIGSVSFYEQSGKHQYLDPFTGKMVEKDVIKDYGTQSHTLDIIGSNSFSSGINLNYTFRYHTADVGIFVPAVGSGVSVKPGEYVYEDGTPYEKGYIFNTWKTSANTPIKVYSGLIELSKKTNKHNWKFGISEQYYKLDDFSYTNTIFSQSMEKNPRKVYSVAGGGAPGVGAYDKYGNVKSLNNMGLEFNTGWENKLAFFMTDKWDILPTLSVNYGLRAEFKNVNGYWAPQSARYASPDGNGTMIDRNKLEKLDKSYLNLAASVSAVYKMTNSFGLIGEAGYNEVAPQLENYGGSVDPGVKKSTVPSAGFGFFYNHPMVSLVSKGTYIKKDNYIKRIQEEDPLEISKNKGQTSVNYEIETMGWTTDILATPFKGFSLHFLVTLQAPKYKGYNARVDFYKKPNELLHTIDRNFSDKTVAGVSKVLLEIDPSYQFKKYKIWASGRYFSKQFINISNTLYLAPRWETFMGANYFHNRHLNFGVTVVNPLNQRGASGSIEYLDLFTQEEINDKFKNGTVLTGSYMRPFTVEFSATYRF